MQATQSTEAPRSKKLDPKTYKAVPIEQIVLALSGMSATNAATLINDRQKDFGRKPQSLIDLLNAAEKFPHLKSAIAQTKIIETKFLDAPNTFRLLSTESADHLRELKNIAIHRSRALIKNDENPEHHEKDPPEKLTQYIIDHPESAFHFLGDAKFKKALAEKPVLIAKMIAGDDNLHKTVIKEEITRLPDLPKSVRDSLDTFSETVNILGSPQMGNNPQRDNLNEQVKTITNTANLRELPLEDIERLNKTTKETVSNATASMLATLPNTEEKKSLEKKLGAIRQAQSLPGQGPSGFNLYNDVKKIKDHHDAWIKVQDWLADPILAQNTQFNALRPELEKLHKDSTLSELGRHETKIDEMRSKTRVFLKINELMGEMKKLSPDSAEKFYASLPQPKGQTLVLVHSELNESSPQRHLDVFKDKLEAEVIKLQKTAVNQASTKESEREQRSNSQSSLPPSSKWNKTENKKEDSSSEKKKIIVVSKTAAKNLGKKKPTASPPSPSRGPGGH